MDKINGRNIVMESYDKIKKTLAIAFMHDLDANRPEGKMCLSNGECADIEKAFNEQDWPRLAGYLDKYTESEDERIRKWLFELVENQELEMFIEVKKMDVFEWLKKQKEPKLAPYDLQKSFEAGQTSIVDNPEQYGLCKKAEWSEKDEAMRDNILRLLSCFVGTSERDSNPSLSTSYQAYQREIDWLKSLRPQPKQEWSKEDERILKGIIGKIDHDQTYGVSRDEMLNFLKKL